MGESSCRRTGRGVPQSVRRWFVSGRRGPDSRRLACVVVLPLALVAKKRFIALATAALVCPAIGASVAAARPAEVDPVPGWLMSTCVVSGVTYLSDDAFEGEGFSCDECGHQGTLLDVAQGHLRSRPLRSATVAAAWWSSSSAPWA
jgi:hypothetical protein